MVREQVRHRITQKIWYTERIYCILLLLGFEFGSMSKCLETKERLMEGKVTGSGNFCTYPPPFLLQLYPLRTFQIEWQGHGTWSQPLTQGDLSSHSALLYRPKWSIEELAGRFLGWKKTARSPHSWVQANAFSKCSVARSESWLLFSQWFSTYAMDLMFFTIASI